MADDPDPDRAAKVHDLVTFLRAQGHTVSYGGDPNDEFRDHVDEAKEALDSEDLMGYYLVVLEPETTDYYGSSVVAGDTTASAIAHIQMLGGHFRSILEATGLETDRLVQAVVDEALAIGEVEEGD